MRELSVAEQRYQAVLAVISDCLSISQAAAIDMDHGRMVGGGQMTETNARRRARAGIAAAACVGAVSSCSGGEPPSAATEPMNSPKSGPETLVMPALQCMDWTDAEPLLRDAGWHGALQRGEDVTNSACLPNQIGWQEPSPGEVIPSDAPISVRFVP
ncbi:PASTA domain-containing protein [Mycolicibacterium sp. 3033]|nr:PASTA domain-containing protein [Mycolicibacterium aurantiacum]